jgi:hypothetical protein
MDQVNPPIADTQLPPIATPQVQPPVITPPTTPQTHRQLISMLVGISAFALGAAGFFGYKYVQLNKQIVKVVPSPTSSAEPVKSSEKADPTADWKTYTDQKNSISFKYPPKWTPSSDVGLFNDDAKKWILDIESNRTSLSTLEWANKKCGSDIKGKLCSIDSSEIIPDAYVVNYYGSQYTSIDTITKQADTIFEINVSARNPNQPTDDIIPTYNQIISSLKFTSPSVDSNHTTNRGVYNNGSLGISFAYPAQCSILNENSEKVTFGCDAHGLTKVPTFTISDKRIVDLKTLVVCNQENMTKKCKKDVYDGDTSAYQKLGDVTVQSTPIIEGCVPDGDCGDSTIIESDQYQNLQIQVFPWGAGIDSLVHKIFSTFKFTK